jgi:hypothetical protein
VLVRDGQYHGDPVGELGRLVGHRAKGVLAKIKQHLSVSSNVSQLSERPANI